MIGLVGGIGAGKSLVASLLENRGAKVIDSDQLAHEVYADSDVQGTIRAWWGDAVFQPSGAIDRRAIAEIVFADAAALRRLEGLLYPRIEARRAAIMREAEADPRIRAIVIDAPKLFEAGVDRECDVVIFVDADRARRRQRVSATRGWDENELSRRERSQAPLEEKRRRADFVIANEGDEEALRRQVDEAYSRILGSCGPSISPEE